ncbi:MAG: Prokaryotic lipoprotein-attachment site [Moraxellaceae bacterium]|jgi:predicted small lipoprotein YifL|nr:Prokaryotic lipoprotein-attachment site [Moraxellaceae bacterium]
MPRLLLLMTVALLAACGQKGPLYLPSPAVTAPATPVAGPAQVAPAPVASGAGAPAADGGEGAAPVLAPAAPVTESESRARTTPAAQP